MHPHTPYTPAHIHGPLPKPSTRSEVEGRVRHKHKGWERMKGPPPKPHITATNTTIIQFTAGHLTCWGVNTRRPDRRVLSRGLSRHRSIGWGQSEGQQAVLREQTPPPQAPHMKAEGERRHDEGPFARIHCQPRRLDDVLTGL